MRVPFPISPEPNPNPDPNPNPNPDPPPPPPPSEPVENEPDVYWYWTQDLTETDIAAGKRPWRGPYRTGIRAAIGGQAHVHSLVYVPPGVLVALFQCWNGMIGGEEEEGGSEGDMRWWVARSFNGGYRWEVDGPIDGIPADAAATLVPCEPAILLVWAVAEFQVQPVPQPPRVLESLDFGRVWREVSPP